MRIDRMRILSQKMLTASLAASFLESPPGSEEAFLKTSMDKAQPGAAVFLDLLAMHEDELREFLRELYRDAMAMVRKTANARQPQD